MGGLWRGIAQWLTRFRWLVAGLAALVVVLACVLVVPQWLVEWDLGTLARTLTAADRAKAINDVRSSLLQGIGGAVLLLGAFFTYRQLQTGREQLEVSRQQAESAAEHARDQLELAQQALVIERLRHATDQLGHAELDVRVGGIYELERVANDSPKHSSTITEVLTAFVRGHAPWPPRLDAQPSADTPISKVPGLHVRALDVHAALTVLVRRPPLPTPGGSLNLQGADLRNALLNGADLQGADLSRGGLQGAVLSGAKLQGANLSRGAATNGEAQRSGPVWSRPHSCQARRCGSATSQPEKRKSGTGEAATGPYKICRS